MGASHHPSAEQRSDYAGADLAPGAALAISIHLEFCPYCASVIDAMDRGLGAPRLVHAQDRIEEAAAEPPAGAALPAPLRDKPLGRWRWAGPGLQVARVETVSGLGEATLLMRGSSGAALSLDGKADLLVVLAGAVHASGVRLGPGDFLNAPWPTHMHADREAGCLCLVVRAGELYARPFSDWLRRIFTGG